MNYMCQPLGRELNEAELAAYNEHKKILEETGKCQHILFGLYEPHTPPWHGCIVCGEPVA